MDVLLESRPPKTTETDSIGLGTYIPPLNIKNRILSLERKPTLILFMDSILSVRKEVHLELSRESKYQEGQLRTRQQV